MGPVREVFEGLQSYLQKTLPSLRPSWPSDQPSAIAQPPPPEISDHKVRETDQPPIFLMPAFPRGFKEATTITTSRHTVTWEGLTATAADVVTVTAFAAAL